MPHLSPLLDDLHRDPDQAGRDLPEAGPHHVHPSRVLTANNYNINQLNCSEPYILVSGRQSF